MQVEWQAGHAIPKILVILSFFAKNLIRRDKILHFVQDDKEFFNNLSERATLAASQRGRAETHYTASPVLRPTYE